MKLRSETSYNYKEFIRNKKFKKCGILQTNQNNSNVSNGNFNGKNDHMQSVCLKRTPMIKSGVAEKSINVMKSFASIKSDTDSGVEITLNTTMCNIKDYFVKVLNLCKNPNLLYSEVDCKTPRVDNQNETLIEASAQLTDNKHAMDNATLENENLAVAASMQIDIIDMTLDEDKMEYPVKEKKQKKMNKKKKNKKNKKHKIKKLKNIDSHDSGEDGDLEDSSDDVMNIGCLNQMLRKPRLNALPEYRTALVNESSEKIVMKFWRKHKCVVSHGLRSDVD